MPDYYWNYLKEINWINHSDILQSEKKRQLAELDGKYTDRTNSIIWKCQIPLSDFLSMVQYNDGEIPFADADGTESERLYPTKEQQQEITSFLNEFIKSDK